MAKITFEISDEEYKFFKWYGEALVQEGILRNDSDYGIAKFLIVRIIEQFRKDLEKRKNQELAKELVKES